MVKVKDEKCSFFGCGFTLRDDNVLGCQCVMAACCVYVVNLLSNKTRCHRKGT